MQEKQQQPSPIWAFLFFFPCNVNVAIITAALFKHCATVSALLLYKWSKTNPAALNRRVFWFRTSSVICCWWMKTTSWPEWDQFNPLQILHCFLSWVLNNSLFLCVFLTTSVSCLCCAKERWPGCDAVGRVGLQPQSKPASCSQVYLQTLMVCEKLRREVCLMTSRLSNVCKPFAHV